MIVETLQFLSIGVTVISAFWLILYLIGLGAPYIKTEQVLLTLGFATFLSYLLLFLPS